MRKIYSNQIGLFALVILSTSVCASNNNGTTMISLLDTLSTIEKTAQDAQTVITPIESVTNATNAISLTDILVNQLGVSQQQALGGAGALFQLAKARMEPQAFSTLSQSVPGMSSMLDAAPTTSDPISSLAGGLSSMMGDTGNTLGSMASLAASFNELNLSPEMVGQFIPIVTEYVKNTGGQVVANLLQAALMP